MASMLGEQLKASGMQVYSARASHIVALSFGQMAGTLYTEKEQSLNEEHSHLATRSQDQNLAQARIFHH